MKCPESKDLLEITAENERHVTMCAECQDVIRKQEALMTLLDTFEAPSVSMDFNRRLWQRIDSKPGFADVLRQWLKPAIPLTVAAALVVVGFVYDHRPASSVQPRVSASEAEKVERALDDIQLLTPFEKLEGDPAV